MTADRKIYRCAYGLACFIIALTFLSAGYKILYPSDFALAVYRFHLLPGSLVNLVALYVSWLEMVCAICLLFVPKYRIAALWIALGLLLLFTGGIAINLLLETGYSCGCFSSSPLAKPMSGLSIARNTALMALIGLALFSRKRSAA